MSTKAPSAIKSLGQAYLKIIHVDPVHIWSFLSINLDIDKVLVHHLRHKVILEAFVRENVTPMARRVSDTEEDHLVLCFCSCDDFGFPFLPLYALRTVDASCQRIVMEDWIENTHRYRVVLMLQQIRRLGLVQRVSEGRELGGLSFSLRHRTVRLERCGLNGQNAV